MAIPFWSQRHVYIVSVKVHRVPWILFEPFQLRWRMTWRGKNCLETSSLLKIQLDAFLRLWIAGHSWGKAKERPITLMSRTQWPPGSFVSKLLVRGGRVGSAACRRIIGSVLLEVCIVIRYLRLEMCYLRFLSGLFVLAAVVVVVLEVWIAFGYCGMILTEMRMSNLKSPHLYLLMNTTNQ